MSEKTRCRACSADFWPSGFGSLGPSPAGRLPLGGPARCASASVALAATPRRRGEGGQAEARTSVRFDLVVFGGKMKEGARKVGKKRVS